MDVKNCDNLSVSPWIRRFSELFPKDGRALDLAAGQGRHSFWCIEQGLSVTAIDRGTEALEAWRGANPGSADRLEIIQADLEDGSPWPLDDRRFDLVIVVNYLWRPLLPPIRNSIAEGGLLLYETFSCGNEVFGRPSNPDFLLQPGELLQAFSGELQVIAYEQGRLDGSNGPMVKQRIAATMAASPAVLPVFPG